MGIYFFIVLMRALETLYCFFLEFRRGLRACGAGYRPLPDSKQMHCQGPITPEWGCRVQSFGL